MVLDFLPQILQHDLTKLVVLTTLDEVSRVEVPQAVMKAIQQQAIAEIKDPNSTLVPQRVQALATQYTLGHVQWLRALRRIVMRLNPRGFLPDPSKTNSTVNPQCFSDTMDFVNAIAGTQMMTDNPMDLNFTDYGWVVSMLDSFGKPSGGILKGAVHFVGSYEECHSVHAYIPAHPNMTLGSVPHNYVTEFDTRFCRVTFNLPDSFTKGLGVDTRGITLRLHWGMCFPATCHSSDVASMMEWQFLESYNFTVHTVMCAEEDKLEEDASAIVAMIHIYWQASACPRVAMRLVKAFSMVTNMPKILSGKKSANSIHCLHGIRFFSIMWIILGHTYNYGVINVTENPTTENLVDADKFFKRFTYQGVMAAGFGVDTFFLLSGFLVCYLTMKDLAKGKNNRFYWVMFYVHRFWRLTPIYMIVLMMFGCLYTYLGKGPLWPENLPTASNCKDNWWTNLLYVNNFVYVDDPCMGWSWYLANDMQFYWISPIFLLPLFYIGSVGVTGILMLAAGGMASAFYQEWKYRGDLFSMHEDLGFWDEVYIKPWCRVSAYCVGLLLGYIFYKKKNSTIRLSVAVIGWLWTWAVGFLLCYITFSKRRVDGEDWPRWFESAYEAFGRPLWALCVAWIIYACHYNRGGFINSILSWEGFLPLSRLTYAAYLLHPIIMMLHAFSWKSLIYIDDFNMIYLFMGHTVTTFLTAFFFSTLFEAPALALEKLVFRLH
ncbi:nose resistant to fluoxetine protein 6-like [Pomacea canaliculata]|uniref:nose resistant to fluoxetine protein 6-like n=1 Tax=Pomacea canaliculata TaxID=400727 RepID=UPI000D73B744|nr:nose resistant to fluoxetine protein 6-like [Pomacea canaliculata]